jgi:hypothetical protein
MLNLKETVIMLKRYLTSFALIFSLARFIHEPVGSELMGGDEAVGLA